MARKTTSRKKGSAPKRRRFALPAGLRKWLRRGVLAFVVLFAISLIWPRFLPTPYGPYMLAERLRLGGISHDWVAMEKIAPDMARSVVAAEDANFCRHWGFDMSAIRAALANGATRGGSTISQQTVKNVYLWQGRSWPRKVIEAAITPLAEVLWPKRRMLEIYLNIAEFDEGVFGVEAAAQHYYNVRAKDLSAVQSARLAVLLPNPKERDPRNLSKNLRARAAQVLDGAATIQADGRSDCFDS